MDVETAQKSLVLFCFSLIFQFFGVSKSCLPHSEPSPPCFIYGLPSVLLSAAPGALLRQRSSVPRPASQCSAFGVARRRQARTGAPRKVRLRNGIICMYIYMIFGYILTLHYLISNADIKCAARADGTQPTSPLELQVRRRPVIGLLLLEICL